MEQVDTTKAKRYLNDAKARERIEDSEYERMLTKPMFRKHKRDLRLTQRKVNLRDDTLEDILRRSAH